MAIFTEMQKLMGNWSMSVDAFTAVFTPAHAILKQEQLLWVLYCLRILIFHY